MSKAMPALALAVILGLCFGSSARADLRLDISNVANANVEFQGFGTSASFTFNNNTSGQGFDVTQSSNGTGPNTAVGLFGTLGGTYSYTKASIVTTGPVQTASVTTSNGSLTITDANNVSLTGNVTGVNVSTVGTLGTVDMSGTINLTNVSYLGTNQDLVQLKNEAAASGGVVTISFQFLPAQSLTQLTSNGLEKTTSYSGSIATTAITTSSLVPEPSSLAIAGIGALGMIGFALRRRNIESINGGLRRISRWANLT